MESNRYKMTISRLTVDKLGVKLYDRVSAVIAELIANSYDADATEVVVTCPMDEYLATKTREGRIQDKGYVIEVRDNGIGMTPEEVNSFYLVVGKERRLDARRGDKSRRFRRKVMGRKGVGKLAPFGVCQKIEIITSGGELIRRAESDNEKSGYLTAHVILERGAILTDVDTPYEPETGDLDNALQPSTGTSIRLSIFDVRRVPSMDEFERALSQRFGISAMNWSIKLSDPLKTQDDPHALRTVGAFEVEKMEKGGIRFVRNDEAPEDSQNAADYAVVDSDDQKVDDLTAGFEYQDGFYPITGWVAYSTKPYKDELMAGIRVYCRGKIAAQTHIFNLKAGFTGEYDVRSYLVGEIHADWLDAAEDLIRTDRQDILWSHELGQAFEAWGQKVVKKVGETTRVPKKKKAWEIFKTASDIDQKLSDAFPGDARKDIRENTLDIAKVIAQSARDDELQDKDYVEALVQLSMIMGPPRHPGPQPPKSG